MTKLLNKEQVSEILGVSVKTLERIVADGSLQYYRIRGQLRFNEQDVMRYIAGCKEQRVTFEVVEPAPARMPGKEPSRTPQKRPRSKAVQTPSEYYPGMKVV